MNTKGLEPYDVELLEGYLERAAREATQGNFVVAEELVPLLRCSLGRIAANRVRRERLPVDLAIPDWGREQHIADWIVVSMIDGEKWLSNVDGRGCPKKLTKCASYDDLVHEADRYSEKRRAQMAKVLGPDDETFEANLGGGYTLVRLLTPAALDLESARMHHCLGDGAYDQRLAVGWGRYLSVRDGRNRPVATIELQREANACWTLRQIAGKRNDSPAREVMGEVRTFAVAQAWRGRDHWWPTVTMADGTECDIDRIPEGATIRGLNHGLTGIDPAIQLPDGLTVMEGLLLTPLARLPENMRVKGIIEFTRRIDGDPLIVLPDSLNAKEIRVCAAEDLAQPIPAHLIPRIKVRIRKVSGHSFASLQQVEKEQGLDLIEELGAVVCP